MKKIISNRTHLSLALLLVSLFTLAFVYIAEHVFNLLPCTLCLYQRKPYFAVVVFSLIALFFADKKTRFSDIALFLAGLSFVAGTGIAGFHTGVEQGWWKGLPSCGDASLPMSGSVEDLKNYLTHRPIVDCRVAGGKFLGISMTGYNLILSIAMTIFTFFYLGKIRKQS